MSTQANELKRCRGRIGKAVLDFFKERGEGVRAEFEIATGLGIPVHLLSSFELIEAVA